MAIFSFFKLNKHKQFEYKPLFYDKDKEEFNERVRRIEEEMGVHKGSEYKPGIHRGTMRSYLQTAKKENRHGNLRLFLIVIFLLAVAYYLFLK